MYIPHPQVDTCIPHQEGEHTCVLHQAGVNTVLSISVIITRIQPTVVMLPIHTCMKRKWHKNVTFHTRYGMLPVHSLVLQSGFRDKFHD